MMKTARLATLAASCLLAFGWTSISAKAEDQVASEADAVAILAEGGERLTPFEALLLFQRRSWMWEDGAGYFASPDRHFVAYSGSGEDAAIASGRWIIRESGAVCMDADWEVAGDTYPSVDCFAHSKSGDVIFQRRLPDGQWYVFKDEDADPPAEYSKFQEGDLVSERIESSRRD